MAAASVTTAGKAVKAAEAPEEAQVTDSGTQTKEPKNVYCATAFYEDGTYKYTQTKDNVEFTKSR